MPSDDRGWLALFAVAWISQALGQGLIAYALGLLPTSFSALVILIEPLTAAILGWIWLGEAIGPRQALGGTIVLAGIVIARWASRMAADTGGRPRGADAGGAVRPRRSPGSRP